MWLNSDNVLYNRDFITKIAPVAIGGGFYNVTVYFADTTTVNVVSIEGLEAAMEVASEVANATWQPS